MLLNELESERYARQIMLPEVGIAGQIKLKNASVLCIGAGGLGCILLQYLAASGVGKLGIVDDDVIEISNLQRQLLYRRDHLRKRKVDVAKAELLDLNPHITIEAYAEKFQPDNARELIARYDVVADCTDNLANRYLVNAICLALDKPFVYAGVSRYQGQCMMFYGKPHPCFACVFPYDRHALSLPDCNQAGVLAVLPGMLGLMQANLILQYLLPVQEPDKYCLHTVDMRNLQIRQYQVIKDPACACCVQGEIPDYQEMTSISAAELRNMLKSKQKFTLLDVRTLEEYNQSHLTALHIPLAELSDRLQELPRDEKIVVYCQSGARSLRAAELLKHHGFTYVCHLHKGVANFNVISHRPHFPQDTHSTG